MKHIRASALKQSLDRNETLLIDVREPGEFAREHIAGAGLVFAGVTDTCMMAMLLAKLPYNRPKPAQHAHA